MGQTDESQAQSAQQGGWNDQASLAEGALSKFF